MKKILSSIFVSLVLSRVILAANFDSPADVVFVNTGLMNVHTGGINGVAMYVPFGMRCTGADASVILNGQLNLGGNFYQDALTPAFKIDETTTTSVPYSTGIFRFVKYWNQPRLITSDNLETTYDRGDSYIAFPHVRIATNDTLVLQAKMGMDALTIKRESASTGGVILKSDRYGDNVYDASLRITGSGKSTDLVDVGSVVVEREMSYYRSISGEHKLFGFASPFNNTQLSGYFAGNWVRRPIADPETGHTRYIFGNEQDNSGVILPSQYIYNPLEELKPAQAYLIRPRPAGFNYQDLRDQNGLSVTDAEVDAYDQTKFAFNGKVYELPEYEEQLFAEDSLFRSPYITGTTSTINWLIGNSYTAPIGTKQLIDAMGASPLRFSPYIWVYPAGSSTYQSYKISGNDNVQVLDLEEIPAMSIFMIRVLSGTNPGKFAVTRDMQRHAPVTHSIPMKAKARGKVNATYNNQVTFKVMPADNIWNFDLAAIGLRADASLGADGYDMTKVSTTADVFQLYSLSSANTKLSANAVPTETSSVKLCFRPVSDTTEFQLEASHYETLSTEGIWLEDTKTDTIFDVGNLNSYSFISEPGDNEERFIVHFVDPGSTGLNEDLYKRALSVYMLNDVLIVKNLLAEDVGSLISLFDGSGRLIKTHVVERSPQLEIPFNYLPGVYIIQLKGTRLLTDKFLRQ
ncbi:MAG: hypothetical protein PHQ11_06035 [Paludibacter sp.]|nr:hypothetical protein [Paludibacter sp.]MDD4199115.1 hypothetical protein [Paludibacter sp.]MDD4428268.1 hypothetical protein [Paludibacter sp.]